MNLLGDGVHWIAAALVVLALVVGPWVSTRRMARRWLHAAQNLVVIVLCTLCAVTALALELNHDNAWYPTLDDLYADDAEDAATSQLGAKDPARTFPDQQVTRVDRRQLAALPGTGRVRTVQVPTSVGHRSWRATVILPEGYDLPQNAHRAYPVLLAAHGIPGSPTVWTTRMSVARLTDQLVESHRVQPFITVAPDVTPGGMDTECVMGPDGPGQMETWLGRDLPTWVRSHLRVVPQRTGWAWAGYSMGGWCASMLTLRHPSDFAAGISLGGYARPSWAPAHRPPWGAESRQAAGLDLVRLARKARPQVGLFVQTSRKDPQSWPTSRDFLAAVKAPTTVRAQVLPHGGHTFDLWTGGLTAGVRWLGAPSRASAPDRRPAARWWAVAVHAPGEDAAVTLPTRVWPPMLRSRPTVPAPTLFPSPRPCFRRLDPVSVASALFSSPRPLNSRVGVQGAGSECRERGRSPSRCPGGSVPAKSPAQGFGGRQRGRSRTSWCAVSGDAGTTTGPPGPARCRPRRSTATTARRRRAARRAVATSRA
ncbi:alpha/beta hydrolase [Luteococcus peritonei]|uniref:Alpha/beta hydrolase n=1 Tax=Luteococcus peritonei TaxID=88874 RepID=A0ABW4RX77_9ACTN